MPIQTKDQAVTYIETLVRCFGDVYETLTTAKKRADYTLLNATNADVKKRARWLSEACAARLANIN